MTKIDKTKMIKDIKNWSLIQKVRIEKFIKEHKYFSAIVGVFIMSSVIALIVFASDEDAYAGKVIAQRNGDITISSTANPDTENTKEVQSFSTIVYDIPFKLVLSDGNIEATSTRIIDVTASLDESVDAVLTSLDDNVKITSIVENGKQTVTLNDYASLNNSGSISLYLKVYNIKDGTTISPDITICDKTSKNEENCFKLNGEDTKVTVRSRQVNLVPKAIPGLPYDYINEAQQKKRYVPFGVLVGLNKSDINTDGSLTGIYINPNINLSLSAVSTTNDLEVDYIEQVEVDDFYGLYAGSTKGNAKMDFLANEPFPYHNISVNNSSSTQAVYNSGVIEYSKCELTDSTCNLYEINDNDNLNVYSLKINGIKTDGRYVTYNSKGTADVFGDVFEEFDDIVGSIDPSAGNSDNAATESIDDYLAFGTYYVTAIAEPLDFEVDEDLYRGFKLNVKYKTEETINDGISYWGFDTKDTNSTKKTEVTFLSEKGEKLNDSYELAYGEEVILKVVSNYEYINIDEESEHKYNLTGKIPVAAMEYEEGLEPFEMIEYSSDVSEFPYFLEVNGQAEELSEYDVSLTYVACVDISECTLDSETEELMYSNYEDFKTAKEDTLENGSELYLSYIKYEISNLPNNANVDFRLRLKVGTNGSGDISANVVNEFSYEEFNAQKSSQETSMDSVTITPYKARLSLNIDGNGDDVSINLSGKTSSTIAIYPKVNLPANVINTNTVGLNKIDELNIAVTLPDKVNYAENDSYLKPVSIEDDGKKLIYVLNDKSINSWIDPIYVDVNYSIDIASDIEYIISATVDAVSKREDTSEEVIDISDIQDRTAVAKLRFINTGILSYSMTTSNTTVSKDKDFDIITKIFNRSSQAQSNLELITILPYNDQTNSSYHGSYELDISKINSALCTVSSFENLTEETTILWEDCSSYSDSNYDGVTAIKTTNINLEPNQGFEQSFNIIPLDNSSSDYYKIESYIKTSDNKRRNITPITISVETIKITGIIWEDFNGDGLMSTEENRIPDVELQLYDSQNDELIQTVISDKNGVYTFDQVYTEEYSGSGDYYIVAKYNTTKYSLTSYNVGDNKSINSSFCSMKGNSCSTNNDENYDDDLEEGQEDLTDSDDFDTEDDGDSPENDSDSKEEIENPENDSYEDLEEIENGKIDVVIRTENFTIGENVYVVSNINLGLSPKKLFSIKLNKYITSTTVTNPFGNTDNKTFGNVSLAKINVRDMSNVSIKVTYTIEVENKGYYPGYVYRIKDIIPEGMKFNASYPENVGWELSNTGYLENKSLSNYVLNAGEKKYINLSLDLVRKEAGSFINYAIIEESDLEIYNGTVSGLKNGGTKDE